MSRRQSTHSGLREQADSVRAGENDKEPKVADL